MQGDIERATYTDFLGTARTLLQQEGVGRFFNGWSFRTSRMICAIWLIIFLVVIVVFIIIVIFIFFLIIVITFFTIILLLIILLICIFLIFALSILSISQLRRLFLTHGTLLLFTGCFGFLLRL